MNNTYSANIYIFKNEINTRNQKYYCIQYMYKMNAKVRRSIDDMYLDLDSLKKYKSFSVKNPSKVLNIPLLDEGSLKTLDINDNSLRLRFKRVK